MDSGSFDNLQEVTIFFLCKYVILYKIKITLCSSVLCFIVIVILVKIFRKF